MLPSYVARMALTLARGCAGPRIGPLDEARLALRVWPTDLDPYLHLNNGRYLTLMDIGRLDLVARSGMLAEWLRRRFERFEIATRIASWEGKWFEVAQRFERAGVVHAEASVRGQVRSRAGAVPFADVLAALGVHAPSSRGEDSEPRGAPAAG